MAKLDIDSPYPLTAGQIEQFRRDGFIKLKHVLSPEVIAHYARVITPEVFRLNTMHLPIEQRDTYNKAFLQVGNIWTKNETVKEFCWGQRLARLAAELMGVRGVRMYHDQALYKEPGGGPTPFHQDMHYWPLDTDNTVTMWMPLVNITGAMGSMTFVNGTHRMGYLGELPISDESESVFRSFIADRNLTTRTYGAMAAGDATFHAGWTLHGAPGNTTGEMREVMTVIYMAANTRVNAPDNENRQQDLEKWLPGLKAGDLAASPLNPVLWGR